MADLRSGCRAMIIGGFYRTNDGSSVLVEQFVPNGAEFYYAGQKYAEPTPMGDAWLISGDIVARDGITGQAIRLGFGLMPGKYLMPIDGEDFSHEKESEKQLQNA